MNPGEVILVKFPFADLTTTKKRPALVFHHTILTPQVQTVTVAMITSQIDGLAFDGDVRLKEWAAAGLLHPSLVRLAKMATIERELVAQTLGKLTPLDLKSVRRAFQRLYRCWLD